MSIRKIRTKKNKIKWEVRVHINGRNSKRISKRFDKKLDAEHFLREYQLSLKSPYLLSEIQGRVKNDPDFFEEAEYWLEHKSKYLSDSYLKRVKRIIRHLKKDFQVMRCSLLTTSFLYQFRDSLLIKNKKPATANRWVDVIRVILNYSYENGRINFKPMRGYKSLPEVRSGVSFLSKDEITRFIDHAEKKYFSEYQWIPLAYRLLLNTGLRSGELWGLNVKDFDLSKSVIKISRQFNAVSKKYTCTKGKRERFVPCPKDLMKEILKWCGQRKQVSELVFLTTTGTFINHNNFVKRHFKFDIEQSGVRPIRFHDLRHTAVTMMVLSGISLKIVKEIAGHKDIQTTMRYLHLADDSISNVAKTFRVV